MGCDRLMFVVLNVVCSVLGDPTALLVPQTRFSGMPCVLGTRFVCRFGWGLGLLL